MGGLEQQVCSACTHLDVKEVCFSVSSCRGALGQGLPGAQCTPCSTLTSHRPQTEHLEPVALFS